MSDPPVAVDAGADGAVIDAQTLDAPATTDTGVDGPLCDGGLTACGAACVNLQTSDEHCGQCFAGCGSGTCAAGQCAARLVFVTNGQFNGNLGGVGGADMSCQQAAITGARRGKYKAWVSRPGDAVDQRMEHATVPYRLHSGKIVANNWNNLVDMGIDNPINEDEKGQTPADNVIGVWTGTFFDGSAATVHCNNWTSASSMDDGRVGDRTAIDASWTSLAGYACNIPRHLYCVEQR